MSGITPIELRLIMTLDQPEKSKTRRDLHEIAILCNIDIKFKCLILCIKNCSDVTFHFIHTQFDSLIVVLKSLKLNVKSASIGLGGGCCY